jgi:hypothetical protein
MSETCILCYFCLCEPYQLGNTGVLTYFCRQIGVFDAPENGV